MKNSIWLSTSLYCLRDDWHLLLSEAINPFFTTNLDRIEALVLEFNYIGGENIRMALLTNEGNADRLSSEADLFFKNAFLRLPFHNKKIALPVQGLFLPFPNNSIQYGLYRGDYRNYRLQKELSLLMIEALSEESIDDETIVTFAFYLHISLMKVMLKYHTGSTEELLKLYHSSHSTGTEVSEFSLIKNKFEDNKDMLKEIFLDIMNPVIENTPPNWLSNWEAAIEDKVKQAVKFCSEAKLAIEVIHSRIAYLINKQLTISGSIELLLFYFIRESFL